MYEDETIAEREYEQAQSQPRDGMGAAQYRNEDGEPSFG